MSENKEKPKNIDKLLDSLSDESKNFNDMADLLEWMASPRVYWDNFKVTIPVENPKDIKWFALGVAEA